MTNQRKLHSLLIDIGHRSEEIKTPFIIDINELYDKFLVAVDDDDLTAQRKAVIELCGSLIKWAVEKG